MTKCGMCGFFGECTHRKETDSAENCSQYHDDYYVKYNYPDQWEELVERYKAGEKESVMNHAKNVNIETATMDVLDDIVYEKCEEHIDEVFDCCNYKITLI